MADLSRWHQALAYALLGLELPVLRGQVQPDLDRLVADLDAAYGGRAELLAALSRARAEARTWPVPVPAELQAGLGAAQFWAGVQELLRRLGVDDRQRRTIRDRPLDAAEQALVRETPPHHGG